MKRRDPISVSARAATVLYGSVMTSSKGAVRETLHEAVDAWLDAMLFPAADEPRPAPTNVPQLLIEARW